MAIIRDRRTADPLDTVSQAASREDVLRMQREVLSVTMKDEIVSYIARLAEASRDHPLLALGISPRGAISLSRMARARAFLGGRDYVIPEDVQSVFADACAHRVLLSQKAKIGKADERAVMEELLKSVRLPHAL